MSVLKEILLTACRNPETLFFNQLYVKRSYYDSSDDECEYEDEDLTNKDENEVYRLRGDYCSCYSAEGLFYSPILTTYCA